MPILSRPVWLCAETASSLVTPPHPWGHLSSVRTKKNEVGSGRGGGRRGDPLLCCHLNNHSLVLCRLSLSIQHRPTKTTDFLPTKKSPTAATLTVSALKLHIPHVVTSLLVPPQQTQWFINTRKKMPCCFLCSYKKECRFFFFFCQEKKNKIKTRLFM